MKYLYYIILIGFAIVFQLTLSDLIAIKDVRPDLILMAVCFVTMYEGRARGTLAGFAVGLVEDSFGSGLIGLGALSRSVSAFILATILKNRSVHHFIEASLMIAGIAFINNLICFILQYAGAQTAVAGLLLHVVSPALYTSLVSLILFSLIPESMWAKMAQVQELPFN